MDKQSLAAIVHPDHLAAIAREVIKEKCGIRNPPPVLVAMVSKMTYRLPANG